jgi:hypothetical protein
MKQYVSVEIFHTSIVSTAELTLIDTDTHPIGLKKHMVILLIFMGN